MKQMLKIVMATLFILLPMTVNAATADMLDRLVINSSRDNRQLFDGDNHRLLDDLVQKTNVKDMQLGLLTGKGVDAYAKKDYKTALDIFEIDSVQRNPLVQALLGGMYLFGQGVKQDKSKALTLLQKSAKQGFEAGQYLLGVMYLNAEGVKQDYPKAAKLFYKGAKQGSSTSQAVLGWMYERGLGLKQDDSKAVLWYRKAAKQGDEKAQNSLNRMDKNAHVLHNSVEERQAVNCEATTKDYRINGDGTVTDKITGLMWKQCPEGLSGVSCEKGSVHEYTWDEALQHAKRLNTGGGFSSYNDWRVANVTELQSIVQKSCGKSMTNKKIFPETEVGLFWSSISPNQYDGVIVLRNGANMIMSKSGKNPIRLVRGTPMFDIDATMKAKHPKLVKFILNDGSMDNTKKQFWFDKMPNMAESDLKELFDIYNSEINSNSWLTSNLYGHDNAMAALRPVKIYKLKDSYRIFIRNQFKFDCALMFDELGNPRLLVKCVSKETKDPWAIKEKVIRLSCSSTKTEDICRGKYTSQSPGGFDDLEHMVIAKRKR